MARVKKILGEYVFPRCIRRNGRLICKKNGRFRFRRY